MKPRWMKRAAALLLTLCLLPAFAVAESPADAVTRSRFTLGFSLHADAFPPDGETDFQGWEAMLAKLSLSGTADSWRFPRVEDRVYFEGDLNLNGKSVIPLIYEGYHTYRYLRSPALNGQSVHFQMNNFFEFMLKPYYFMGLPTQYLSLLLYPEATDYLVEQYKGPIVECLGGEGDRAVPYDRLYELCQTLGPIASDDPEYQHVYSYLSALLMDLGATDTAFDGLCYLEDWLDFLDPDQEGMTITRTGDEETYAIGDKTLLKWTRSGESERFTLTLPNAEGYLLTVTWDCAPGEKGLAIRAGLRVSTAEETRVELGLEIDGMPRETDTDVSGTARFTAGGAAFGVKTAASFAFALSRTQSAPPFTAALTLDWLHPVTGKPAVTLAYRGDVEMLAQSALKDHVYDNQIDFFHLNDSFLQEYKQSFTLPLALALTPIALEAPAGVINDVVRFFNQTGILASLGIE